MTRATPATHAFYVADEADRYGGYHLYDSDGKTYAPGWYFYRRTREDGTPLPATLAGPYPTEIAAVTDGAVPPFCDKGGHEFGCDWPVCCGGTD